MNATGGDERPAQAVAGLAREVDGLRRSLEPLRELHGRVDDLAKLINDLAQTVAGLVARPRPAAARSWLMLPATEQAARRVLDELTAWIGAVYLRYPDAAGSLPECWCWHPDVVEELLWLTHAWCEAYQGATASVAAAGDWHDRQRPGVVRRIRQAAGSCSFENHITRPGWVRHTSATPAVPGLDAVAAIASWWGTARDQPAPEPPPSQSSPTSIRAGLAGTTMTWADGTPR